MSSGSNRGNRILTTCNNCYGKGYYKRREDRVEETSKERGKERVCVVKYSRCNPCMGTGNSDCQGKIKSIPVGYKTYVERDD